LHQHTGLVEVSQNNDLSLKTIKKIPRNRQKQRNILKMGIILKHLQFSLFLLQYKKWIENG